MGSGNRGGGYNPCHPFAIHIESTDVRSNRNPATTLHVPWLDPVCKSASTPSAGAISSVSVNCGVDLALFRWVPVISLNNRDVMAWNECEKAVVIAEIATPIQEPFRSSICYRHKKLRD